MHVIPQLRELERRYSGELAVIGVHSAKFPQEKATQNVQKAILRYEIEHPVVNDRDFQVWQQYTVRAWPTLVFVDPLGKIIGKHEGEFALGPMEQVIGEMVSQFEESGLLDHRPLQLKPEREKEQARPLSFPGKILADPASGRLLIADSNHNRIVVASLDGQVIDTVGAGGSGFDDGGFADALFNDPQGMALEGDNLYVADTKNHAIRRVDLANRDVSTVAGTGEKATSLHGGGDARTSALSSPWDVALYDGILYIAMAGFHQLWRLALKTGEVRPHAGSGRERIVDGPLAEANLAQPSGIVVVGDKLYFTDSETSAVRVASIADDGTVSTIAGLGLFTFGDVDGMGEEVRLQHPIGIVAHDGAFLVADTYNNKIKNVFAVTRTVLGYLGTGKPGYRDGPGQQAEFHEPGGLDVANGTLYIADTNNHAIRVADLGSQQVSTLNLTGI